MVPISNDMHLWDHLMITESEITLHLNGNIYEISTAKKLNYEPEYNPKWTDFSRKAGLPVMHANTVNAIITQVQKN